MSWNAGCRLSVRMAKCTAEVTNRATKAMKDHAATAWTLCLPGDQAVDRHHGG